MDTAQVTVVLDLPVAPSTNRTRRVDWAARRMVKAWMAVCDAFVMQAKRRPLDPLKLCRLSRFQVTLTLSEDHTKADLDNPLKAAIDYLRRIEVIENDAPKNMRRVILEWGVAPEGMRLTVEPVT